MFDVGFTEIMLIGVVALVVIGPERLPDVARTVGGYVGKLQRFVTGVKRDIRAELDAGELKKLIGDQKEQIDELRNVVRTTRREMDSGARSLVGDAKKTLAGLEDAADSKPESAPVPGLEPGRRDTSGDQSAPVPASRISSGDSDTGSWKSRQVDSAAPASSVPPDMTDEPDARSVSQIAGAAPRATGTDT